VLNNVSREDLEATLRVFAAFKLGASSQTQQAPTPASYQGPSISRTISPTDTNTEEGV